MIQNSRIVVAYLNIHGQSGLSNSKQKQIEDFIKLNDIDILNCQEINIEENSFKSCPLGCPDLHESCQNLLEKIYASL